MHLSSFCSRPSLNNQAFLGALDVALGRPLLQVSQDAVYLLDQSVRDPFEVRLELLRVVHAQALDRRLNLRQRVRQLLQPLVELNHLHLLARQLLVDPRHTFHY